jgi:hypothetical protein
MLHDGLLRIAGVKIVDAVRDINVMAKGALQDIQADCCGLMTSIRVDVLPLASRRLAEGNPSGEGELHLRTL